MNTNGTTTSAPATALVKHETHGAIEPATLTELRALAKDAADSGFLGQATPSQALLLMMAGRDLGFSYTQALRMMNIVKNKPALSADGMVAVCLSKPDLCEFFRPVEETETSSTWETKRRGDPVRRETFTIEDAQRADLLKQNAEMYRKYPRRMLSARAKSFLARDVYPELLGGLYDPDELREIAPERVEYRAAPVAAKSSPRVAEEVQEVQPRGIVPGFLTSITNAATLEALVTVGEAIAAAKSDGTITVEEAMEIAGPYAERKKALRAVAAGLKAAK